MPVRFSFEGRRHEAGLAVRWQWHVGKGNSFCQVLRGTQEPGAEEREGWQRQGEPGEGQPGVTTGCPVFQRPVLLGPSHRGFLAL